jgi:ferritin-like metal-binding protein YciE
MQKQFIELAEATGKTKQQTVNIIRQIVAGERDTADTLAQLQVQYAQVKSSADLH